jgi:plasmid stabilization system protein ParE
VRIRWSKIAFEDLISIRDYIAKDIPSYAGQFIDKLMSATDKLADLGDRFQKLKRIAKISVN